MLAELFTIDTETHHEIIIERSRFITYLMPTESQEQGREYIKKISKVHTNATHNCSAYIIGNPVIFQKYNDDGEPQGTAGMPMLQALSQRQMTNITAVVTRYFGSIKLGAGGLVRAYGNAITTALDKTILLRYIEMTQASFQISYEELSKIYYLQNHITSLTIIDIQYAQTLTIIIAVTAEEYAQLNNQINQLLNRIIDFRIIKQYITTLPL